jgi:hypothetical protein
MSARCRSCGRPFLPRAAHHRLCLRCYRDARDRRLQAEAYTIGYHDARGDDLDPDLLARLVKFCHPDHNVDRFDEANAITVRLLELRQKAAA